MTGDGTPQLPAELAAGVRTMVTARWWAVAFGIVQVTFYAEQPYPPGYQAIAYAVVGVAALANVAFEAALRRRPTGDAVRRLALVMLVTDVLVLSAVTWVYAFDDVSVIFAVLFLLPVEGAVLFGLPGAMWTWVALLVLYIGREAFATRYGFAFEVDSVTFRGGLIGINGYIVGRLVRDLRRQRRRVEAVLDQLRGLDAFRARVISMLAHDLRAPLAGSQSAFTLLQGLGDRLDDDRREEVLEAGLRQNERATLLVRDLLDLARTEAGTLTTDPEDVDLGDTLARVAGVLGDRADVQVDAEGVRVHADPVRLEQVLHNLLDNAVKYGAPPLEVTAQEEGEQVIVTVRDHGPGIPDDVEVFSPFSGQGEGSVGLGLWIVGQLVEAMDGSIHHERAHEGTRFTIRLPAARPAAADPGGATRTVRD